MAETTGLCECGCGQPAPVAERTVPRKGWVKGQPKRFVHGHNSRGSQNHNWRGDESGYIAAHAWMNRKYPRTGVCEQCGNVGKTKYALIRGRGNLFDRRLGLPFARNRASYRELCDSCHNVYDYRGARKGEGNWNAKLSSHAVREIRHKHAAGQSQGSLAREYGVTRESIRDIVCGRTWKHIEP